jgi:hypothetical protein
MTIEDDEAAAAERAIRVQKKAIKFLISVQTEIDRLLRLHPECGRVDLSVDRETGKLKYMPIHEIDCGL